MAQDTKMTKVVGLLIEAATTDTVYRDIHLRRARQLLSSTLDESAYRSIGSTEHDLQELTSRSRTAALHRNWAQSAELAGQIDRLRQRLTKTENLAKVGKEIYEADAVAFEPFSPGKHLGANAEASQASRRAQVIDALASLAKLDAEASALYAKRRK